MLTNFRHVNLLNYPCLRLFAAVAQAKSGRVSKTNAYVVNLFRRTFPSFHETELSEPVIEKKKTNEKIKIDPLIPKFMRNALVLSKRKKKISLSQLIRNLLPTSIPILSKLYRKSDLSLIVKDFKTSYANVKYNLNFTSNPLITIPRDLLDKIHIKSEASKAVEIMQKYKPGFTLEKFEKEVRVLFEKMLTLSKTSNLKEIKQITSESALALIKNDIKERKEKGYEYIYKKPLYVEVPVYQSAEILGEDSAIMKLKVTAQECIGKKVKRKGKTFFFNKSGIESTEYLIEVTRNPKNNQYIITNYQKVESQRQLI